MKKALDFFKMACEKKRLAHLYLIYGAKGSGKLDLAYEVAFLMIYDEKIHFENQLKKQIIDRKLSNIFYIEPDGNSIKKEQILALQAEFSKTSLVNGARVYIINHIDKMTQSASNSLLKFMEEPLSKSVYGILLTEQKELVLQTILSRSQLVNVKSLEVDELKSMLIEANIDIQMANILPYLTKNFDDAIALSSDPNYIELIYFIEEFIKTWNNPKEHLFLFFSKNSRLLTMDRSFFQMFLEILTLLFVDLIHYKTHQPIIFENLKEDIQYASARYQISQIEHITQIITETLKRQSYYINLDLALDQLAQALNQSR